MSRVGPDQAAFLRRLAREQPHLELDIERHIAGQTPRGGVAALLRALGMSRSELTSCAQRQIQDRLLDTALDLRQSRMRTGERARLNARNGRKAQQDAALDAMLFDRRCSSETRRLACEPGEVENRDSERAEKSGARTD